MKSLLGNYFCKNDHLCKIMYTSCTNIASLPITKKDLVLAIVNLCFLFTIQNLNDFFAETFIITDQEIQSTKQQYKIAASGALLYWEQGNLKKSP